MRNFEARALEILGTGVLRGLGASLRFTVEGREPLEELRRSRHPFILAFWHSGILPLAYFHRNQGFTVLVSRNRDGEYIARVIRRMGFQLVRGSANRGGASGLRALVRTIRRGGEVAITPDGSRGPARKFKPGALLAAQLTGAPIIPLAAGGKGSWRVNSWDRMVIPKPFARFRVIYGAPYRIPREASREELKHHAGVLEAVLDRLTDAAYGHEQEATEVGERSGSDAGMEGGGSR